MKQVKVIKKANFYKIFNVKEVDLVKLGLFNKKDLAGLRKIESAGSFYEKSSRLLSYLKYSITHPRFLFLFIIPKTLDYLYNYLSFKRQASSNQIKVDISEIHPISNCILKANIAASFKPKVILEIGTYLGWGAASFKKVCPDCEVYTINPRTSKGSYNPINNKDIGSFYKRKGLKVKQIWADSNYFDYSGIPKVDVTYIDGNHDYEHVFKDLEKTSKITSKSIILDDYIPKGRTDNKAVYGPWNEGVVKATDDFLLKNPKLFNQAFWIEETQLCVLVK